MGRRASPRWGYGRRRGIPGRHLSLRGGDAPRQGYRWLQVFTGDPLAPERRRKAVAIKPMTCPPNAFVTGEDLLVLEPGDTVTHTWGIEVFNDDHPREQGSTRHERSAWTGASAPAATLNPAP